MTWYRQKLLIRANGYSNVTVNAFHGRNSDQDIARTYLRTPVFIAGKQIIPMQIVGIPKDSYVKFLLEKSFSLGRE